MANSHWLCNSLSPQQIWQLEQLFGGCFHEDFLDFAPDEVAALAAYIRENLGGDGPGKMASLVDILAQSHSDETLEQVLDALGSCFYPQGAGMTPRAWLGSVSAQLRAAASGQ